MSHTMNKLGWVLCMSVCAVGVIYLARSDAMINVSAALMSGSSPESRESSRLIAIGVVLALLAFGSIAVATKSMLGQIAIGAAVVGATLFSAVLTIQGEAMDQAANDNSKVIQGARRSSNKANVKILNEERERLQKKMDECEADKYFGPCGVTEVRLAAITKQMTSTNDDSVSSIMNEKVNMAEAIYDKTGIPAMYVLRARIYARAFATPIMISVLMGGFWLFYGLLFGELTRKKPQGSGNKSGSFLEKILNGKAQPSPTSAPKVAPKKRTAKQEKPHLELVKNTPANAPLNAPKSISARGTAGAGVKPGAKQVRSTGAKRSDERLGFKVRAGTNLNRKYKRNYDDIYKAVKYFIQRKAIDPKHAQIKNLGVGTDTSTKVLAGLRGEGIIERKGNSHELLALKYINDVDTKMVIPELEKLIKAA